MDAALRCAVVVVEQPTKSWPPDDFTDAVRAPRRSFDHSIANPLARTLAIAVLRVLGELRSRGHLVPRRVPGDGRRDSSSPLTPERSPSPEPKPKIRFFLLSPRLRFSGRAPDHCIRSRCVRVPYTGKLMVER